MIRFLMKKKVKLIDGNASLTYDDFWACYLRVQRGEIGDEVLNFNHSIFTNANQAADKNQPSKAFVIFNSDRKVGMSRMIRAIEGLRRAKNEADIPIFFKDVGRKIPKQPLSFFLLFVLRILLADSLYVLKRILKRESKETILCNVFRRFLRKKGMIELILFTELNTLTEMFRHAAVAEGLMVTTFMHGAPADYLDRYYRALGGLCEGQKGGTRFINMAPNLPQLPFCEQNMVSVGGKQAYFPNEKKWVEFTGTHDYNLLVVGGDWNRKNYEDSSYFKNECQALKDCQALGLKVCYAPHPGIAHRLNSKLPTDIDIYPLWKSINSSKVIVGHWSTSLAIAKLFGKNVLIFQEAWEILPTNVKQLFPRKEDAIYNSSKVLKLVQDESFPKNRSTDGVNLENIGIGDDQLK